MAEEFDVSEASIARITSDPMRYPDAGGPITPRRAIRKLNEAAVSQARLAAGAGRSLPDLAEEFGVDVETMRQAVRGESWIDCPTPPVRFEGSGLSDEKVRELRTAYHEEEATIEKIAEHFGITRSYAKALIAGKERKNAGGPIRRIHLTPEQHEAIRTGYRDGMTKPELMETLQVSLNQVNDSLAGRTGRNAPGPILPPAKRGKRPRGQRQNGSATGPEHWV